MSDCLFCKIIAGEIPSAKGLEDDLCYAFKDISPLPHTFPRKIPQSSILPPPLRSRRKMKPWSATSILSLPSLPGKWALPTATVW